jgi:hypothetical protein
MVLFNLEYIYNKIKNIMKSLLITESEKNRILNMHKSRNILMEQELTIDQKNTKTLEKLTKEGWKKSSLTSDKIKTNSKLTYFYKAGMNSSGFAGVFVGESEANFKYFIYVPGYQGYRGMSRYEDKDAFFDQFGSNIVGIYEGGKYFNFWETKSYD